MRRRDDHQHVCSRCRQAFDCYGRLEKNHDGFPEVICDLFHLRYLTECEDCQNTIFCDLCGVKAAEMDVLDDGQVLHACKACAGQLTEAPACR